MAQPRSVLDLLLDWKVAGGLGALVLGAFAFTRRRRADLQPDDATTSIATPEAPVDTTPPQQRTQELPLVPAEGAPDTGEWEAPRPRTVEQTADWVPPPAANAMPARDDTSHVMLPGASMTREFHITQQFRPSAERVVALSSPEEIVQQARTHYMEDNDVFKAIDLLEMAISARNDAVRPWQALFAIYRRENMTERFQRLALSYREAFGRDESWPSIGALGRQLDSDDPLYGEEVSDESVSEDLIERWLGVPLDFTAHLLANELHDQLMDTYPGRKRRKPRAR